jgi:hypothetical protein
MALSVMDLKRKILQLDTEIRRLHDTLDRANAVLQEYEDSGFTDPGRHIDAVRDALGRRYPQ